MHIVIDAHLAVKKIDGVARYLLGLLRALPGLDSSIRFTVLALPDEKSGLPNHVFEPDNVSRVEFNLDGPSPWQHLLTPRLLRELHADVYHHPQYDLPMCLRMPTVVTIHDLKFVYHRKFLVGRIGLKSAYIKRSLRYALRKADRIISVSENTRQDIESFLTHPARRTTVIHHGVDAAPRKAAHAEQTGLDIQGDFVLFVGTRRPHKNIEGLVRAVNLLRKQRDRQVDLVVAGKAYSDYTGPEKLVEHLGLTKHVHFLDFVPEAELPTLYRAARVVSLPSFYEGFGFPVLEAMAYGKPFIGSNVTSIPEVVGDAGLLVEPRRPEDIAEKIDRILSDPQLESELIQKARRRAAEFSWRRMAEKTLDVYLEAAQRR